MIVKNIIPQQNNFLKPHNNLSPPIVSRGSISDSSNSFISPRVSKWSSTTEKKSEIKVQESEIVRENDENRQVQPFQFSGNKRNGSNSDPEHNQFSPFSNKNQ